jgi:hypothetical protein
MTSGIFRHLKAIGFFDSSCFKSMSNLSIKKASITTSRRRCIGPNPRTRRDG